MKINMPVIKEVEPKTLFEQMDIQTYLRSKMEVYVATLDTDHDEWWAPVNVMNKDCIEGFLEWLEENP